MKKLISLICTLIIGLSLVGCTNNKTNNEKKDGKLNVVVSFYPLKEFTENIGGDKVEVKSLVPDGSEPHDFEPKTKDLEELLKSDIFIYNGLGLEDWVSKVINASDGKVKEIVDSSKGVNKIETDGKLDPHIWLSLKEAQIQCGNIKDALIQVDEKNKDYYEKNYQDYIKKLQGLYDENKDRFSKLTNKDFITGHEAFGYLCRDFGLNQKSVEDVFGEGEVTPQKLKDLVDYCKQNNIKTIFMESLASPKVSETLAKEVGAKVEKIYTMESQEDNKTYLQAAKENLDKIYNALNN
ncbi:metal ABC transporter substrate-binding protein [Clostridium fallax]|uniref:Zinc transport system substrate-binding protein n=1 Tax=Clostridium fallax TaxID=1533 RepID=A0A1M4VCL0_9CLOT|nr:metal ABC transporter substrate-binding protein [Clostridium fallax]SHE66734.1 zinc transport system substrate-binding protein [Clostridium fallax]SQB05780.1 ABC transporter substrate-binding protein [Clostridium fallax]